MLIRNVLATTLGAAAAVCAVAASPASAATIITSASAFAAATSAPGVDTYAGFSTTALTLSPIIRSAGGYTYTAAAASGFTGAGTSANPALSTLLPVDSVVFTGFAPSVRGIGGLFYGSDALGAFKSGDITLTLVDLIGATVYTFNSATAPSFVGFVANGPIVSLTVTALQPSLFSSLWPTIDNLTIAQAPAAAAVPEPVTWALMLAGFGMVGFSLRRRAKVSTSVTYA